MLRHHQGDDTDLSFEPEPVVGRFPELKPFKIDFSAAICLLADECTSVTHASAAGQTNDCINSCCA
jgi:hypothetical protein